MTSPASNNPMSPELAAIAAEAAAIAQPEVIDPANPPAPPVDYLTDARGITDIAAESLSALYPRTGAVLNEEKREKFAASLAPVMEKYGLTLGVLFGKWGAEINLAFVTVSFALPLAKAIQDDRAEYRMKEQQAERAAKNPDPQPARSAADPYNAAFTPE